MQITYGWILTPRPFKERLLKVMKQAVSCKHRQAVKTIQCEKKLFNSHVNSSQVRKMCCETCGFNISQDGIVWKAFLSACCCKNDSEIGFLTVTSSWGYQHGFSTETSWFLSNTTRSSRPEVFCKKGVLRNFAKFCNFNKKRLWDSCLSVNFAKFLRKAFA